MMIFEGVKCLLMSHWVLGKNAVGVPHASVLIDPEPFRTSDGTLPPWRGQNQTLMKFGVRSIAYLQNGNVSFILWGGQEEEVHAPPTAIVVERRSIVVGDGSLHATSGVAVRECIALQSGRVAARKGEKYPFSANFRNSAENWGPYPLCARCCGIEHP
jgi:hypothetical protein